MSVVRAIVAGVVLILALGLLESRNRLWVSLAFYVPVLLGLSGLGLAVQRGQVRFAGWVLSLLVWALVTLFLVLLGGLEGHNAMAYVVAMTIAGTVVGGRAAAVVGALSVIGAGAVLALELRGGVLPAPIAPTTGVNSFVAVVSTLLMSGWLLSVSLRSLKDALARAEQSARERDLAANRLEESKRLETVGRVAAGVAHDLNNVLAVVGLSAEALQIEAQRHPSLGPLVDDLSRAGDQATLLTRRLVSLAKTDPSPPEQLEVGLVAEQFAPLLRRLMPSSVQLTLSREQPLPRRASRSAIEMILLNLVINARDAMPEGGIIDVRVGGDRLSVKDQGIGMSEDVRKQLFTPFFTTKPHGTGLGLVNVAKLSESLDARVEVQSRPGAGATFTVHFATQAPLPVSESARAP